MLQNNLCKICGRFFEADGTADYCPPCKTMDEEMYETLRKYLIAKPRASILEVTSELNISVKTIKRFLREDRLEIVEANNSFLKCESCGLSIHSGHMCKNCKHGKIGKNNDTSSGANENTDNSNSLNIKNQGMKYL